MKRHYLLLGCAVALITGCATTTTSPVNSQSIQDQLQLSKVTVNFAQDREVPGVYDKSVATLLDGDEDSTIIRSDFAAYVDANGGRGVEDDQLGERYLEHRIAVEVGARLRGNFVGSRPANVDIDIEKIVTPNAATMLLVGEVKGITYDIDVTDAQTQSVLVELTKPSKPYVERSSLVGGGGGLLGLAVRSGGDTNIRDLEQMITAVAEEVSQILTGEEVNKTVAKKIRSTI